MSFWLLRKYQKNTYFLPVHFLSKQAFGYYLVIIGSIDKSLNAIYNHIKYIVFVCIMAYLQYTCPFYKKYSVERVGEMTYERYKL